MELQICLETVTFTGHARVPVLFKKGSFLVHQMCWVLIRVTEAGRTRFQKLFLPVSWLSACSPGLLCASVLGNEWLYVCAACTRACVWMCTYSIHCMSKSIWTPELKSLIYNWHKCHMLPSSTCSVLTIAFLCLMCGAETNDYFHYRLICPLFLMSSNVLFCPN